MPQSRFLAAGASVVFVACLLVYGSTLVPTVPGGDSGELVAVANELAVAHPPGYPLWTLLAHLFTFLPAGSVAARVAWLSAACTSAAAALVFATTAAFVRARAAGASQRPTRIAALAGTFGAALFAFSPLVWSYAVVAEVFPLNSLFAALLLALALRWDRTRQPRDAMAIAFATGLGLANHHTLLLFAAPILVWMLWSGGGALATRRRLAQLAAAGAAGLLPYAYLWIAGRAESPLSWGETDTIGGFVDHVLRRDYGTLQLLPVGHVASSSWIAKIGAYGAHFVAASLGIGALLAAFAAAEAVRGAARRDRGASWILLPFACAATYLAVFLALSNVAVGNALLLGVLARFWMQVDVALAVVAGAGLGLALLRLPARWIPSAGIAVAVFVLLRLGLSGGERADRGAGIVERYAHAILDPLPPRALLLTRGNLVTNTVRYLQSCEGVRDDVVVLDQELLTRPWYVRRMARRFPELRFPGRLHHPGEPGGFTMREFLDANAGGRPIYVYSGWKTGDPSTQGSWRLWPEGLPSRALPGDASPNVDAWAVESAAALADLEARGWPPLSRYPESSWERIALEDVWQARADRAVLLLREAIARGDDRGLLTIARGELEAAARNREDPPPWLFLNLGIALERLSSDAPWLRRDQLAAWKRFLSTAAADDPQRHKVAEAVARLDAPATSSR